MARPKGPGSRYLLDVRERLGLKPKQVLAKLRAMGHPLEPDTFGRYERGERHPPVQVQWQLSQVYGVPFLDVVQQVEALEDELEGRTSPVHLPADTGAPSLEVPVPSPRLKALALIESLDDAQIPELLKVMRAHVSRRWQAEHAETDERDEAEGHV